jgi:hypothetical protein
MKKVEDKLIYKISKKIYKKTIVCTFEAAKDKLFFK